MEIVNYDTLFEQYAGIGFEKQYSLAEVIGDNDWNLDMDEGMISFGNIKMSVQVLGTYSNHSATWLWAWANEASNIPAKLLGQAKELKKMGEEYNIEFLTKEEYKIEPTDVHALGIIASGKFGSSAYYAGDFGDGIALVTLDSPLIDEVEYNEQARILDVFPQVISIFGINHKRALKNYLVAKEYATEETEDLIKATKNNNTIIATFDDNNRLIKLNGEIK